MEEVISKGTSEGGKRKGRRRKVWMMETRKKGGDRNRRGKERKIREDGWEDEQRTISRNDYY